MRSAVTYLFVIITAVASGQEVLEEYIRYGLENNLALKQKEFGYRKSIESLREAKSFYFPGVSFNARYTVSEGGRVINFPVGDLLNPVYSTLNALTASNLFPMTDNQEIRFLRPTEHETRIRIVQPVFNTDLYFNSRIRKELSVYEEADAAQYRRELVAEIKKAYYNLAMAEGILSMLKETRKLLVENVRVNRRLVENNKLTRDNVYRSEAELDRFDQEFQVAEKDRTLAVAWFNFLLNKPLQDSVIVSQPVQFPLISDITSAYINSAVGNREEIKKLELYGNVADLQVKMNQSDRLPDVSVVFDYGFQGEKYRFNGEQDYMQASAILSWNLFSGFRNRSQVQQAMIDRSIAGSRLEEARKQIELQVINTLNELKAAEKGIAVAESRLTNAKEGFRLVSRKYEEGQAALIEFLDARTNLTQAEENLIISKFTYLSCYAEFEKVAAIDKQ